MSDTERLVEIGNHLKFRFGLFASFLLGRLNEGKPFEGTFKFNPRHQEADKKFEWRFTLDNPTEPSEA